LRIQQGDIVFDTKGRAGVVVGRNADTGDINLQTKGEQFEQARRRGLINGLKPEDRQKYNEVIDTVQGIEDPHERIRALREKIDTISQDPRNHAVARYLEGQLVHTMEIKGIKPTDFTIAEENVI
jgi:hypothetical protein